MVKVEMVLVPVGDLEVVYDLAQEAYEVHKDTTHDDEHDLPLLLAQASALGTVFGAIAAAKNGK